MFLQLSDMYDRDRMALPLTLPPLIRSQRDSASHLSPSGLAANASSSGRLSAREGRDRPDRDKDRDRDRESGRRSENRESGRRKGGESGDWRRGALGIQKPRDITQSFSQEEKYRAEARTNVNFFLRGVDTVFDIDCSVRRSPRSGT